MDSRINKMVHISLQNQKFRELFWSNITVKAICEELFCVKVNGNALKVKEELEKRSFDVAGVSKDGKPPAMGYVKSDELGRGRCKKYLKPFTSENLMSSNTPLVKALKILKEKHHMFIIENDEVRYIVTISDIKKPIVRAYIFGFLTALEVYITILLKSEFINENEIEKHIPNAYKRAKKRYNEDKSKGIELSIIDYLHLSEKLKLALHSKLILSYFFDEGYSEGNLSSFFEELNKLRNQIVHAQELDEQGLSLEWVIKVVEEVEKIVILFEGGE